jgi:hypothetical protein
MNRLSKEKRVQIVAALVEGCSIRATTRMTGASKNTITKLIVELGATCIAYMDKTLRNITSKRIQVDEIWSFCYSKQKNVPEPMRGVFGYGDVWTFVGIDADSKLVMSWLVGQRDAGCATEIMRDIESRVSNRVQMTTDGHRMYLTAVPDAFAEDIDYAQLVKLYGNDPEQEKRYSPAQCIGTKVKPVIGSPDPEHISTSYRTQSISPPVTSRDRISR